MLPTTSTNAMGIKYEIPNVVEEIWEKQVLDAESRKDLRTTVICRTMNYLANLKLKSKMRVLQTIQKKYCGVAGVSNSTLRTLSPSCSTKPNESITDGADQLVCEICNKTFGDSKLSCAFYN